jgi:DNA-binding transcriptional LysR family regulator
MTASLDDLVSLALFARVVEAGSFTAAARALGLSKSVVSARVARLEDHLGARLLHRTTRRLSLSQAGTALYERAARMVAAANDASELAEGASREPRGRLRISAPVTLSQMFLGPVLAEFLRGHPSVQIDLDASDRMVDLVAEGFDLAVRIVRIANLRDSSMVARKLATDRLVVVGSPSYLARAGTPRAATDLAHHNCLRYAQVSGSAEWGFRGLERVRQVVEGSLVVSDGTVLREAAAAGLGLAVLPSFMVAAELASRRLVAVLDDLPSREIGIFAVYPHRRNVPAKVRAFVDFLVARFARAPWRDERAA